MDQTYFVDQMNDKGDIVRTWIVPATGASWSEIKPITNHHNYTMEHLMNKCCNEKDCE